MAAVCSLSSWQSGQPWNTDSAMQQLDTARAGVLTLLAPRYGMSMIGVPGRSSCHPIRSTDTHYSFYMYGASRIRGFSTQAGHRRRGRVAPVGSCMANSHKGRAFPCNLSLQSLPLRCCYHVDSQRRLPSLVWPAMESISELENFLAPHFPD